MNPKRWQQVEQLLHAALDLPRAERSRFLQERCHGDEALHDEVASLLAHESDGGSDGDSLGDSLLDAGARLRRQFAPVELGPGQRVGAFRILEPLAAGGMGIVYLAEQDEPHRRVAIKILAGNRTSPTALARFRQESEALARLDHSGIARVLAAGTLDHPDGDLPYLALEYIPGGTLREYVEAHDLSLDARLELGIQIVDAVQHAHQNGVIHRDLKPSNILMDSHGQPRLVDFGLARRLDSEDAGWTHSGELLGTLGYMSPEQLGSTNRPVDARTDIYSLGVVLYELLAGRLPYSTRETPVLEAARIVQEEIPQPLERVAPACRGDLSLIVAHALEKDPDRRYTTAAELAADLRRVRNHEPISVRRPSILYPLGRWARRNWALATLGSLFAVTVVVAGIAIFVTQQLRLEDQRASLESLQRLLGKETTWSHELPLVTFLERVEGELEAMSFEDAVARSGLHERIGVAYWELCRHERARAHLEKAHHFSREGCGELDTRTLRTANILGDILVDMGETAAALTLAEQWYTVVREGLGREHEQTLRFLTNRADALVRAERLDDAVEAYESLHQAAARALQASHPDRGEIATSFGRTLLRAGRLTRAESLARTALTFQLEHQGPENSATLRARTLLGETLLAQRDFTNAERQLHLSATTARTALSDDHAITIEANYQLGRVRLAQGRKDEAARLFAGVVDGARRVLPPQHRRRRIYESALSQNR